MTTELVYPYELEPGDEVLCTKDQTWGMLAPVEDFKRTEKSVAFRVNGHLHHLPLVGRARTAVRFERAARA